jgi:hypothetical protein
VDDRSFPSLNAQASKRREHRVGTQRWHAYTGTPIGTSTRGEGDEIRASATLVIGPLCST